MKQFFFAIGHPELVPGDSGRPSPPSAEQIAWANRGIGDCWLHDFPYIQQFRFNFEGPRISIYPPPS